MNLSQSSQLIPQSCGQTRMGVLAEDLIPQDNHVSTGSGMCPGSPWLVCTQLVFLAGLCT